MKILLIGNGFDLANGLPTRYSDFLDMLSCAKAAEVSWSDGVPMETW